MSSSIVGTLFLLAGLLLLAHLMGALFARFRQPRVIGEILAGVLLGPFVLGKFLLTTPDKVVADSAVQIGLLLLMFLSGTEVRGLFRREDRSEVAWLASVGTALPFVIVLAAHQWIPMEMMQGKQHANWLPLLLVLGIAASVTSIPVISRIFHDLKILHTRFAGLVLGVAVVEDVALWAVLAVALALAESGTVPMTTIAVHLALTAVYFGLGLTYVPKYLRKLHRKPWNKVAARVPHLYLLGLLAAFLGLAQWMGVSLIFAAFLAGLAATPKPNSTHSLRLHEAIRQISRLAFACFIPLYFALVGHKLVFGKEFSWSLLIGFLALACALKLASVWLGAFFAGFRGLDALNLAITTNARGGPGIVLASVAYEAGIVNAAMYTTLVLTAILTSQAAGAWLDWVIGRGLPLLSGEKVSVTPATDAVREVA